MTEALTAAQMREIERAAIESGEVTGLELMERAGQGVLDAVLEEWPDLAKGTPHALVFCGPGNNGGDGFVVARLLAQSGWEVRLHLLGDPAKLPPDARSNHDLWVKDHDVAPLTKDAVFQGKRPDLIVDAVFGIGLTRPMEPDVAEVLGDKTLKQWKGSHKIKKVAVDCPSGLNLDSGMIETDMAAVLASGDPWPKTLNTADLTVTFHAAKLGHWLGLGPTFCRKIKVVDIGLGGFDFEKSVIGSAPDPERVRVVEPFLAGRTLPSRIWPASFLSKYREGGHKYEHGHVIVFAGGVGRGGAARLAARTALRSGAGLVTVICPPSALIENACQLNAIMLRSLAKDQSLEGVVDRRATGFCLGPGMGVGVQTRSRVIEVLGRRQNERDWRDPVVVLDADALTSFADDPSELFEHTHARTILTPHEGEFERLFPDLSGPARGAMSKVDAARRAAKRAGCLVLLKGPDTVIAQPDGGASIHSTAYGREVPWLATAGAGDVLAGLIAGLAAPPVSADLFVMSEIAAYLHVEAARSFGPGLIAEDLPDELPKVFSQLGL